MFYAHQNHRGRRTTAPHRRALTLIEVLVSLSLFTVAMAGIISLLFQSYETALRTRLIDEGRSVMRTIADQFMRTQAEDAVTKTLKTQFTPTTETGPTGTGLVFNGVAGNSRFLSVTLGETAGVPVVARITREVVNLDSSGNPTASAIESAAGYLVQARFNLRVTAGNRLLEDEVVLVRLIPNL